MTELSTISRTCDLCGQTNVGIVAPSKVPLAKMTIFRDKVLGWHCKNCGTYRCRSCKAEVEQPRCSQCGGVFIIASRPLLEPDVDFEALMAIKTPGILTQVLSVLKQLGPKGTKEILGGASDGVKAALADDKPKPILIPHRAPVNDLWPGRCSSCHQETDNPYSFVLYSARRVSLEKYSHGTSTGYTVTERLEYSDIQEHPCRVCDTCQAASRDLWRGVKIAAVPAVLVTVLVAAISQEYGIGRGLLFGLGTFVVAFILIRDTQTKQPYLKAQSNVSAHRKMTKENEPGEYQVLSEKDLENLLKRSGPTIVG
jgi:predicted RNA-binding Zn-ribbon protein involved in translation (DUF1610 family)